MRASLGIRTCSSCEPAASFHPEPHRECSNPTFQSLCHSRLISSVIWVRHLRCSFVLATSTHPTPHLHSGRDGKWHCALVSHLTLSVRQFMMPREVCIHPWRTWWCSVVLRCKAPLHSWMGGGAGLDRDTQSCGWWLCEWMDIVGSQRLQGACHSRLLPSFFSTASWC